MYARAPLQALGPARTCLRVVTRQCQRQRNVRFYSNGKDDNGAVKQEEFNTTNEVRTSNIRQDAIYDTGSTTTSSKSGMLAQNEKSKTNDDVSSTQGLEAYSRSRRERAAATAQQLQNLRSERSEGETAPSDELLEHQQDVSDELQASEAGNEEGISSREGGQYIESQHPLDGMSPETIQENIDDTHSLQEDLAVIEQFDKEDITPVTFNPAEVSRAELLHSGRGTATISAANFEGVIQDRIKMLTDTATDNTRWAPELAKKMMRGGLISFNSEKEKDEVVEAAKTYAHKLGRSASNVRKGLPDVISEYDFAPLTERMQASIVDRYVRGKHANLAAKPHKSEVLNHVRSSLFRNSTYLARDGAVFLRKVEGMLAATKQVPKQASKQAPKQGGKQQGKPVIAKK